MAATSTDGESGAQNTPEPVSRPWSMSRGKKITLLAVVAVSAWHFLAILTWMGPGSWTKEHLLRVTRRYTRITKSDQYWAMFAPDPLSINRRVILKAELPGGETREVDLTTPANQAMRSFTPSRVGKTLKAHDRIMAGDESVYEKGFALHECVELMKLWQTDISKVTVIREYEYIQLQDKTFRISRGKTERANLGTYECLKP